MDMVFILLMLPVYAIVCGINQYLNYRHRQRVETIHAAIHLATINSQNLIATSIITMSAEALGTVEPKLPKQYFYEVDPRKMQ